MKNIIKFFSLKILTLGIIGITFFGITIIKIDFDFFPKIINEFKQIYYSKFFEATIDQLRTTNTTMFNIKYFLPNGKEAFIKRLDKGEKYTLFYTNNDISDIFVPEKYKFTSDLDPQVCWGVTILCINNSCNSGELQAGPRVQKGDSTCYIK